ncbi:MAG: hypothetical protein DMF26_19015 [Verrucomicrobia bacterium]|nr:MAG: hypothetical protein DMF26_19015 [Verrucomicrobiota bacterium]
MTQHTIIFLNWFCDLSVLDGCSASSRGQRLTLQAEPMNWFCKLNSRISPAKAAKVQSEINKIRRDRRHGGSLQILNHKEKIISASRRNQHASRVRSPELAAF